MPTLTKNNQISQTEFRAMVAVSVRDALEDSDFGLELTDEAQKRLKIAKRQGGRRTPMSQVLKKYY